MTTQPPWKNTNRVRSVRPSIQDMIDDALLRPGRLEVHVEIGLPDEAGRVQILNIHTQGMVSEEAPGKER